MRPMTELSNQWLPDDDEQLALNLQGYLQAREEMFTTSRTVSISEMATTLAHEINTPVATLSNLIQGLKVRLACDSSIAPEIMTALDSAAEQALFTSDVIKRIRDFTQARTPSRQILSIKQLVAEAASLLDWYFVLYGCRLDLQIDDGALAVKGDKVMLQQVILNVLKNAADAMTETLLEHRIVHVSVELRAKRLRIVVRDHGAGLHDVNDSLFTPFVSSKPDGMGVGLNICRSFLDLHGGRLWLADAEEGGCRTLVELPLYEANIA